MRQRQGRGRYGHWVLVFLCLGSTLLPLKVRRVVRDRLLTVRLWMVRSWQTGPDLSVNPTAMAESSRVRLLEAEKIRLQRLLTELGATKGVTGLGNESQVVPATAYPLAGAVDFPQRVVLDRGRRDGVREGQPVLAGAALVGRVAVVNESSCEVRLVTDPSFQVRATILRPDGRDVEGILTGDGSGLLVFRPAHLDHAEPAPLPQIGETITCSRQSVLCGVPAVLGSVRSLERRPGTVQAEASVLPACDLRQLDGIVVLAGPEG